MRKFTYLIITLFLISCSNNGDKYIGNYVNKSTTKYTIIKKAGDEGYFLTFGEKYENEYSLYCVYKAGCFINKVKDAEYPIMCANEKQLVSNQGLIFTKVDKIR